MQVFCCFYWFEKIWIFCLHTQGMGSKSCSSSWKFLWWVRL